jgi:hypothetical protein
VALILVGGARLGKSAWACAAGKRPIVMNGQWNMANYRPDATHLVLNDVGSSRFGSGHRKYWRDLLGCQEYLEAHDRYTRTKKLKWKLTLIVTCNWDNDPRRIPEIAKYLDGKPCVVVELDRYLFRVPE